jgi:RNA polymerase sigma-70 factor, ECF subfamily
MRRIRAQSYNEFSPRVADRMTGDPAAQRQSALHVEAAVSLDGAADRQGALPEQLPVCVAMSDVSADLLAGLYEQHGRELAAYVRRLVGRIEVAEEIAQQAALRAIEAPTAPSDALALRAWLFRVATNLAIDYLRRHSTWRETLLLETRERAEADPAFLAQSQLMRGSPELSSIAREHLAVCVTCTLRNLSPQQSAALLLKEVHGFATDEIADFLDASFAQVKNWLQSARAGLRARYESTCALITKQGVCYQCVELAEFFTGRPDDPLENTPRDVDARLAILRERREAPLGPWHRLMMRMIEDLVDG